jgi:hypothetical protein
MRPLEEILTEYENTRQSYRAFTRNGDGNKNTLIEYQGRFIDLKADLKYWRVKYTHEWTRRDDKAATAIKFRIAVAMTRGEYPSGDDEVKLPTITNAEKLASGSKEYREFVEQRGFYKESLTNLSDTREDINSYINEIKDRLK